MSNIVRPLLLRMARQGCFRPAWSAVIGDEWQRNAARIWGVARHELQDQWTQLQCDFPDANQGDIDAFKAGLHYSDRKDWHVIAAARAAHDRHPGCSVAVLTRNTRDFNRSELRRLDLRLFDPDQLLVLCLRQCRDILADLLDRLPAECASAGQPLQPLPFILKRERLFRLNRLYPGSLPAALN